MRTCSPVPAAPGERRQQPGERRQAHRAWVRDRHEQLAQRVRLATARAPRRSVHWSPRHRRAQDPARLRDVPRSAPARGAARRDRACPVATKPVAIPATVVSRISGKTLLVPVDSAQIGTSPQALATTRCVPSPPSTTIAATPSAHIRSTARRLSAAVDVIGMSSSSSAGNGAPMLASRAVRPASWRRSALDNPSPAGIISARRDPRSAEPGQEPEHHPGFVGVPEHRRAGDEAADVPPRSRVGDDPHARVGGHAQRVRRRGLRGSCSRQETRIQADKARSLRCGECGHRSTGACTTFAPSWESRLTGRLIRARVRPVIISPWRRMVGAALDPDHPRAPSLCARRAR